MASQIVLLPFIRLVQHIGLVTFKSHAHLIVALPIRTRNVGDWRGYTRACIVLYTFQVRKLCSMFLSVAGIGDGRGACFP